MQILEFANGKRLWFFQCLYGGLSRDLLEALVAYGVDNISYIGTAGATTSKFDIHQTVTPAFLINPDGTREDLNWLTPVTNISVRGNSARVSTPNIETKRWAKNAIKKGIDLVDVELGYFLQYPRLKNPRIKFRAVLAVSDVLTGENRKDMTEWDWRDSDKLMPEILKILYDTLGISDSEPLPVRAYRHVPIMTPSSQTDSHSVVSPL
ncbi:MAG: hypothetical protein HQM16_14210 [Deltaproteobacteria bacterium]|nr:hypothetical protein [Deltaproteobacteria bacterium]